MIYLAADVGGTTIKLGVFIEGNLVENKSIPAQADQPMLNRLEAIRDEWQSLLDSAGLHFSDARGIGLSLPFLVDSKGCKVYGDFGKFPGASDVNYTEWSSQEFGLPIVIENDVRMALCGEWKHGVGQELKDVAMITLGTGIGCAAICGGKLLRGSHDRAGSALGHMTVDWQSESGRCGNVGCAEDLASTATLTERARSEPDFAQSRLSQVESVDFQLLFELADSGDACSQRLLERCLNVWSVVSMNLVLAYDPAMLILGGGVLRRQETILPALTERLRRPVAGVCPDLSIVAGSLEDKAALYGCQHLCQETLDGDWSRIA